MKKAMYAAAIIICCAIFTAIFNQAHAAEPVSIAMRSKSDDINLIVDTPEEAGATVNSFLDRQPRINREIEIVSNDRDYLTAVVSMLEHRGYECHSIHEAFAESSDVWYCLEEKTAPAYIKLFID